MDWVGLRGWVALLGVGIVRHGLVHRLGNCVGCRVLRVGWGLWSVVVPSRVMSSSRLVRVGRRSEGGGNGTAGLGMDWQIVGVV